LAFDVCVKRMDKLVHPLTCLAPLQGFEAAARHLSFTRAAAELCLSQSAISRQVQMLESQLGVSLFVRKTRQLVLTPEGEKLLLTVQDVLQRLASTVAGFRLSRRRPVTVSTTVGIASLWLVPRLANFLDRHPEIDVRVSANNRLVDIEREGIDLALRYVTVDQRPANCRLLAGEDIFPVGAPEVLRDLAQRTPQEQDIARLTLLTGVVAGRRPGPAHGRRGQGLQELRGRPLAAWVIDKGVWRRRSGRC
jgi:LysR family transcriptional regulator, glycine cleavage system transcriptional activator